MQVPRRTGRFHFQIHQPAQSNAERRDAIGVKRGVGYQRDIGLQLCGVCRNILGDRCATYFFFALDQKLHINRQLAVDSHQRLNGLNVHVHLAFVVG